MEVEKDSSALFRQDAEIGVLLLLNGPRFTGKMYFFSFNPKGLGLSSGTKQQQSELFKYYKIVLYGKYT